MNFAVLDAEIILWHKLRLCLLKQVCHLICNGNSQYFMLITSCEFAVLDAEIILWHKLRLCFNFSLKIFVWALVFSFRTIEVRDI